MQYILTEQEYKDLTEAARLGRRAPSKKDLQEVCTNLANSMVLKSGWKKGKVWGCILSVKKNSDCDDEWYCDECPAQGVCPYPNKSYSK